MSATDTNEALLREARIPLLGLRTTLAQLQQPLLRSVATSKKWLYLGHPTSFWVSIPSGVPRPAIVESRFAMELCLAGCRMLYCPALLLSLELQRRARGDGDEIDITPVLSFTGHLFVAGLQDLEEAPRRLCLSYLSDRMASGRPIIVSLPREHLNRWETQSHIAINFNEYLGSLPSYNAAEGGDV